MTIRWNTEAIEDLRDIRAFIAESNPRAAQRMAQRIRQAAGVLRQYPGAGRPGRVADTRELAVSGTPLSSFIGSRGLT